MAISPQRLTIYLYSAHHVVIFAIAQLSCFTITKFRIQYTLIIKVIQGHLKPRGSTENIEVSVNVQ